MSRLQNAIERLKTQQLSCIALKGDDEYISTERGLRPLMKPLRVDPDFFKDAIIIDRVIGKSAAFLLIRARIQRLHTIMISTHAIILLEKHKIPFTYEKEVPYIINDTQTGMCPMEEAVLDIEDVEEAYLALENKIKALMMNQKL